LSIVEEKGKKGDGKGISNYHKAIYSKGHTKGEGRTARPGGGSLLRVTTKRY